MFLLCRVERTNYRDEVMRKENSYFMSKANLLQQFIMMLFNDLL